MPFAPTPSPLAPYCTLNANLVVTIIYIMYYLTLDRGIYGLMSALGVLFCYAFARYFNAMVHRPVVTALSIHITCWLAQFVGHLLFEGRAPALIRNFAQAFLMAPHFVLVECLFVLGLRSDLAAKIEPLVNARLKAFQSGSKD